MMQVHDNQLGQSNLNQYQILPQSAPHLPVFSHFQESP